MSADLETQDSLEYAERAYQLHLRKVAEAEQRGADRERRRIRRAVAPVLKQLLRWRPFPGECTPLFANEAWVLLDTATRAKPRGRK